MAKGMVATQEMAMLDMRLKSEERCGHWTDRTLTDSLHCLSEGALVDPALGNPCSHDSHHLDWEEDRDRQDGHLAVSGGGGDPGHAAHHHHYGGGQHHSEAQAGGDLTDPAAEPSQCPRDHTPSHTWTPSSR